MKNIEKVPSILNLRFILGINDSIIKNKPIKNTIKAKVETSLG
jgi:hypothetical protein